MRGLAALLCCALAGVATAQVSGSASGVSDYRYRGNTFSDRQPAAQGGVTYDDPDGAYAGVFGSTVLLKPPAGPRSHFQSIVFAGYAKRLPSGISVEAGGDYSAFNGAYELNYGEFYLGVANDSLNARIYYSPKYFGQSSSAVYGEINATQPLFDRVRLIMHAGLLRYRYESVYLDGFASEPSQNVADGRVGLRFDLDPLLLEVAWVGISNHTAAYLITGSRSPNAAVVTLSVSF